MTIKNSEFITFCEDVMAAGVSRNLKKTTKVETSLKTKTSVKKTVRFECLEVITERQD